MPARPRIAERPARLPPGRRVYAIGDIHGRLDLLEALEQAIREDIAEAGAAIQPLVVYLGDYVDRGADSRGVIDHLVSGPLAPVPCVHLIGNHDLWLLDFLEDPGFGPLWLQNGGDATLLSYGVRGQPRFNEPDRLAELSRQLADALPKSHYDFLNGLKLRHRLGDYLFVHAGIRPGVPLEQQMPQDLLYIREPFLSDASDHGLVVVHGHTVNERPVVRANRIGVDTGACWTGRLTALVLEDDDFRFLATSTDT